jgi:hypothetical protein
MSTSVPCDAFQNLDCQIRIFLLFLVQYVVAGIRCCPDVRSFSRNSFRARSLMGFIIQQARWIYSSMKTGGSTRTRSLICFSLVLGRLTR